MLVVDLYFNYSSIPEPEAREEAEDKVEWFLASLLL